MRRILLLSAFALFATAVFAQQEQKITGVTINPDNSVTFKYRNPKAVTVEVSGEFMEGAAPLREVDGVWTYTTPPLASEMYFYGLTVDGQPILDLNYSLVKDIPRWMNYFIIGGEKGDLYSVQDVPHGTVASRWYDSAMLQMRRRVNIYTPPGYENSKKNYPVFYLLHGNACDENSWLDLGRAAQILDNLIAAGKAVPMILVMTNGNPAQQAAPAYFGDTYTNENTRPGIAQFPATFGEIIAFIDSNYRTIKKKEGRAIAGFSMGGGHAFTISKDSHRGLLHGRRTCLHHLQGLSGHLRLCRPLLGSRQQHQRPCPEAEAPGHAEKRLQTVLHRLRHGRLPVPERPGL